MDLLVVGPLLRKFSLGNTLVLKEEMVKVTLALTKDSVDFFKKIAKEKHTHYQKMIRALLEQYTEHYKN